MILRPGVGALAAIALAALAGASRADEPPLPFDAPPVEPAPAAPPAAAPVAAGPIANEPRPMEPLPMEIDGVRVKQPSRDDGIKFKLAAAAAYRSVYNNGYFAGALSFQFGHDWQRVAFYGVVETDAGFPSPHLPIFGARAGFVVEGRIGDRVRLGCGPLVGAVMIRRATTGDLAAGLPLGARLTSSVDLYRFGPDRAIYLGLDLGFDFVMYSTQSITVVLLPVGLDIGATVDGGLGVRF